MTAKNREAAAIIATLDACDGATSAQIAAATGLSIRKVSGAVMHLKSAGRVYIVGEAPISANRQVNIYSTKPPASARITSITDKQSWLSPLLS